MFSAKIDRVLVPLDGSRFGEQVLPAALSLARQAGARLLLAHVRQPQFTIDGLTAFYTMDNPGTGDPEQAYLREVLQCLGAQTNIPVESATLEGPVAAALQEHAATAGADLVVMATHGRGPLNRFWLGSVADELVRRLPIPVLLLRPRAEPPDLSRELPFRHVLIPLDGSETAEGVLDTAVGVGALWGAEYTLLRVVPGAGRPDAVTERVARSQRYLDEVAARMRRQSLRVQTCVVAHNHPAVAVLDAVRSQAADLIALATHGRGGLKRLLLGSVADKVIRAAPVPVLVYRPL